MKKYVMIWGMLLICLVGLKGQTEINFTTVPVVNGKVVFEHFFLSKPNLTPDRQYAGMKQWVKGKYADKNTLTGMRYDEAGRAISVSAKSEWMIPSEGSGAAEKMVMNYRFDVSVTGSGTMFTVRDITYQGVPKAGASSFPKVFTAEQTITEKAIAESGAQSERNKQIRRETLLFLNQLFAELSRNF